MVGWHHRLNGHEFEQVLGVGEGQGSLVCCDSWGHKEPDTTEQLNRTELMLHILLSIFFLSYITLKILYKQNHASYSLIRIGLSYLAYFSGD